MSSKRSTPRSSARATPCGRSRRDRLRTARAVADLAGTELGVAAIEVFTSVQVALSAIDRLEVRGRDSAGLHVLLTGHDLDLDEPSVARMLEERHDPLFGSRAVRAVDGALSFVYKAAAEIGELGDNTAALRAAIRDDPLLHLARGRAGHTGGRARPHALGERRDHLRGERPPAQQRRERGPELRGDRTTSSVPTSAYCLLR